MRVKNWLQFIVHHDKILQLATYVLGQLPPALSTEEQEEKAREAEEMKSMIRDSEKVTTAADVNESEVKKIAAETIDRDIGKQSSNADDSYAMEQHFPPCNVCAEVESKIGLMKVDSKISDKRRRALANHYVKFDLEYVCCLLLFLIDQSVLLQEGSEICILNY